MPAVMVQCDVYNAQPTQPLRYRVWVGRELFAEREWRWTDDCYLQENIGIEAAAGRYLIRLNALEGEITVCNWAVVEGAGEIDQQGHLKINHENT